MDREKALAGLAAGIGAIEHMVMRLRQVRRAFQCHGAANMVIGRIDLRLGEPQMAQQVKRRIVQPRGRNPQHLGTELFAQRPLVEHKADVKGLRQRRLDLGQLDGAKTMPDQRGMVDPRRIADGAMTHGIGDDLFDLRRAIAQFRQCGRHRLVDDLEITTPRQLLELHEGKVGLDPGGVTIHHQPDGPGRRNHRHLRIAVAMLFAQPQRLIPARHRQIDQTLVRALSVVQRHRLDLQPFIALGQPVRRRAVIADHPQHMVLVAGITAKGTQLPRHLGAGRIGDAGHDRRQRATQGTALVRIVAHPHIHQQAADIGITQPQRTEIERPLRDFLGRKLRHQHRNLQRDGPEARGIDIILRLKHAILVKGQQVHRGKVAGSIVQKHVFRTGVRPPDRTIFRAGMPGIDRVVILDTRIGTGPCGMPHLIPQIARLQGLGDLAILAVEQFPIAIGGDSLEERIGDADRVVGILARDAGIGLTIPIGVIGRKFDAGMALTRIIQHALGISIGDRHLLGLADRRRQRLVHLGVIGILFGAIPSLDRGKKRVQLLGMHLRSGDDRSDLLLLDHLPIDEILDIGMVRIHDHHLGGAARGATRLDRTRRTVTDLEKAHQAR